MDLRKTVAFVEEINSEAGAAVTPPLRRAVVRTQDLTSRRYPLSAFASSQKRISKRTCLRPPVAYKYDD